MRTSKSISKTRKKYHPDVNKEPDAADKFKEVQEAYDVLSDAQKEVNMINLVMLPLIKCRFGGGGFGGFGSMDDIFSQFFGGGFGGQTQSANQPRRGRDRFMTMTIDFMEAVFGTEKLLN